MDDLPEIDEEALSAVREIMEDEFPRLVASYLDEARRLIADLEQALAQADHDRLQRAAHSLKSSSANIGALRLADAARQLELAGRAAELSGAGFLVESAKSLFEGVRERLASHAPG